MTHVPVLVVGGGPVGLALAGDLGWRGVPCLLVEKSDGVITQPRMDLVGVRTMEFARRWGIVEWVENSPYPRDYRQDYVYVTSLTGFEFEREPFPAMGDEPCPPQSPQKRERCPQDMFDPILARFARRSGKVELRYQRELVDLRQTSELVEATLRDPTTGRTEVVTADYVVGCDGANSTVRELVGIGLSGEPVLTYSTNVVFRCPNLVDLHDKGVAYRFICIGPEGTYATLVAINGADRWRLSIIGDEHKRELSEADIHAVIRRVVGRDFEYQILSVVPWRRRELIADAYRQGRVFLAGDAAHAMSPTGGFGMNTGIGDAVDLSWKLTAVLEGWGGERLLDSYQAERRPVGIRNSRQATANLRRLLSPRQNPPPPVAFQAGPEGDRARREYGRWFREQMAHEWFSIGIHLGYCYEDSPICWPDGTPAPEPTVRTYQPAARPGARAPHVWLSDGRSTLDLFGREFTLLRLGPAPPDTKPFQDAARRQGLPLSVVTLDSGDVFAAYERALVLVRPDGHVAWRADELPADPDAVVSRVRGASFPPPQDHAGAEGDVLSGDRVAGGRR